MTVETVRSRASRRGGVVGVLVVVALAAVLLLWAKWAPYVGKVRGLETARHWSGTSTLSKAGIQPGTAPSWQAAWSFTTTYGLAVWHALLAAMLIAAALQSFVPKGWLVASLSRRRSINSALTGGAISMPSMMCTCCTAPVAVSLRRAGAPTSAVLAYWLGNPLLNPAVLIFLALVAPWQWVVTRAVIGVSLVVFGSSFVASFTRGHPSSAPQLVPDDEFALAAAPRRFARAFSRLALVLIPEYFVVVLVVGAFGGWLFPLGAEHHSLATGTAIVLGTLLVIPTGGEIPLAQGLSEAGIGTAVVGALLITLPAVSLPSLVMVGRAFSWRVTLAAAGLVAVGGAASALLLTVLT